MGDLTLNLSRSEVKCKCGNCDCDRIDYALVKLFQGCCDHFAKRLGVKKVTAVINSGNRCPQHNRNEGGSPKSRHQKFDAIDFYICGVPDDDVADWCEKNNPDGGVGRYDGRTHIDKRGYCARWDNRGKG